MVICKIYRIGFDMFTTTRPLIVSAVMDYYSPLQEDSLQL